MNKDLEKAKEVLEEGNYTLVLVKDNLIFTSTERGIKPLLQIVRQGLDRAGYCVADKVVGKAAAFMYLLMGVTEVHAKVISEMALKVFQDCSMQQPIKVTYENLVPAIRNRTNTGFCPMESAVADIDCAEKALFILEKKVQEMQKEVSHAL